MAQDPGERSEARAKPIGEKHGLHAAIVDACPAAIYAKDMQGRYLLVNRQWEALFHAAGDQAKGKTDYDFLPRATAELLREHDRHVLEGGTAEVWEQSLTLGNEQHFYTSLKFPIRDSSGAPIAVCGILTEIAPRKPTEQALRRVRDELAARVAERKGELVRANERLQAEVIRRTQIEQRLHRSEEYYRALIENALDIVTVLEGDGTIRYVSPAVKSVLGYAPEGRIGKKIDELIHPDDLPAIRNALAEALDDRLDSATIEYRVRHKNGDWRLFEATARNLLHNPAVNGIVVNTRDVTERWEAEETLRRKEAALSASQAALRALTARLLTSQEEERSRIARELHDDLNQRLAFLAVEAERLEQTLLQSPALIRKRLRSLQSRAADLSEDVRRMAHQLHPAVLDDLGLEPALRSYCADFSRLEKIPVRFLCRSLSEPVPSEIALCLYRIAQEALHNVAKHSGAPRATMTLAGAAHAIRLSIVDSGVGFAPERVRGKGGLGVASMEERVRVVNGTMLIKSSPGKGTRITVHIPLRRPDETPSPASSR